MSAWAYEFAWDLSLSEMLDRLNGAGPWSWSVRESFWYGDYLKCRPMERVRARIHDPAQFLLPYQDREAKAGLRRYAARLWATVAQRFSQRETKAEHKYLAQLEIDPRSRAGQAEIDAIFRELLVALAARQARAIETYD